MFNFPKFPWGKKSQPATAEIEPSNADAVTSTTPSIEFFVGVPEELSEVKLRTNKNTGAKNVLMIFEALKALEKFNSFTKNSTGNLRLVDQEGEITVSPSSVKFFFAGEENDDLHRVECRFEIEQPEHWDRFMRFMNRYAEVNGMAYGEK